MKFRRLSSEPQEFSELATYNSEVARGIMHTPEWTSRMKLVQEAFNARQREWAAENGIQIVGRDTSA